MSSCRSKESAAVAVRENNPIAPFQVWEKKPIAPVHGREKNIHGLMVIYATLQDWGGVSLHWVRGQADRIG